MRANITKGFIGYVFLLVLGGRRSHGFQETLARLKRAPCLQTGSPILRARILA